MQTDTLNTDPTPEEIAAEPLMQLFAHSHLKEGPMRDTSRKFCELARAIAALPRNPERSTSLRKLREAKDTAITALIWKNPS
ncbi:MAG TPA: hypothetical protein VN253_00700 [Kofleriaceae bacterium]|nr:hypothetical protein [Kofleriaceae bacterium]